MCSSRALRRLSAALRRCLFDHRQPLFFGPAAFRDLFLGRLELLDPLHLLLLLAQQIREAFGLGPLSLALVGLVIASLFGELLLQVGEPPLFLAPALARRHRLFVERLRTVALGIPAPAILVAQPLDLARHLPLVDDRRLHRIHRPAGRRIGGGPIQAHEQDAEHAGMHRHREGDGGGVIEEIA